MKEGGVGEDSVEVLRWQLQTKKVLMPHFAAAVSACKFYEAFSAFETDGLMAKVAKNFQITPGPATEIQNSVGWFAAHALEKRITILAHVMILRAFPKTVCVFVVMTEGDGRSLREFFGAEPWSVGCSHVMAPLDLSATT
jgi:hypothetical protein